MAATVASPVLSASSPKSSSSGSVPAVLRGLVAPLPRGEKCRVALLVAQADGDVEYHVLPRGAGIDLADMVSTQLEVTGSVSDEDETKFLHVRSYTVLDAPDEDDWYGDDA